MRNNIWTGIAARVCALWLAFCLGLLINRGPIYFADTTAYIRVADAAASYVGLGETEWSGRSPLQSQSPDSEQANGSFAAGLKDKSSAPATPLAGRSIYYGFGLYLLGPTIAAIIQAGLAAIAAMLAMRRLNANSPFGAMLGAIAISSGPVFAALLMPDLLAALSILAVAIMLPWWTTMSAKEKAFWSFLLLAGILSHSATILIVGFLVILVSACAWKKVSVKPVILCLLVGVIAELSFSMAVTRAIGSPPLRPPFISARLVADGPGRAFLQRTCPRERRFVQCEFYPSLPQNSDAILWTRGGVGFISKPTAIQRSWAAEDKQFALAVFASDPLGVIRTTAASVIDQAIGYDINDVVMPVDREKLPPTARMQYDHTLVAREAFPSRIWNIADQLLLGISGILLLIGHRRMSLASKIILCGVLADVIICGSLSTPHDRYLMRTAWLLPLLAVALFRGDRGFGWPSVTRPIGSASK